MNRLALFALLVIIAAKALPAAPQPVLRFDADGSLALRAAGQDLTARLARGKAEDLKYIPGHRGQGVWLPPSVTLALPLADFATAEATVTFWFRPDWSPGDCTHHPIFELDARPAYKLDWRKGYNHAISPDHSYLLDPEHFTVSFQSENLFTGRVWRHYAIRFSQERGRIEAVVDGDTTGSRGGKFPAPKAERAPATLLLHGNACGAYDEVRIFDRWLSAEEIVQVAGLKQPAAYLQEQAPPPGGAPVAARQGTFIDPATGQPATINLPAEGAPKSGAYNPARMPQLRSTPHTKWARPLTDKPVRVLMIATPGFYDEYSMIREAAELWQRLDCDIELTNQPDPELLAREYDTIIVTLQGFTNGRWAGWSDIDPKLRAWVLERVKSGRSGLVWAYPTAPDETINALFAPAAKLPGDELRRGFPAQALPQANAPDGKGAFRWDQVYALEDTFFLQPAETEALAEMYRGPAGRPLIKLNYKNASWYPNMGLTADSALNAAATDTHYDYWMALATRAVLLAAGREPAVRITGAEVTGTRWTANLAPAPGLDKYRLTVSARDMWGRVLMPPRTLPAGGTVTLPGVKLPPRATVDILLREAQGQAVDWFSVAVPPATDPRLTSLKIDKESYAAGQAVQVTATVETTRPEKCRVEFYLTDHEGRRLRRTAPVGLKQGQAAGRVAIPASADSLLMRLEAQVLVDGSLADTRSVDVPVPQEPQGFYAIMYGSPLNRLCSRVRKRFLRDEFGVRGGFHQGHHSWANLAALNLANIEYSGHLGYPMKRSDCEAFAENWEENVTKWLLGPPEKMIPYRPLFYSLGEEHFVLMGSCPTPTANAKFRQWLQGKYASLEELNQLWGSQYKSWDEISMIDPDIVDMLKLEYGVVRFENRRFMEHLFAARHAFLADYLRKVDPQGRTGIHAGWDLWMGRGYDYWLLSRVMEDMMCYGGTHNHYARSFFGRYWGSHYHYNIGSHENVRWHPWYMVLSGARGWSWYTDAPQIWGATTADLHLAPDFLASASEFKAAAEAGDLLARCRYQDDQVAIHYSQDSFQAGVAHLTWIHQRFVNFCFDHGWPFRFVSYEQLAQGELLKRRPKLFILPHSVSLTPGECQAIREYLAAGGVVWADVLPGTYDHHGRKLEQSQLADLFADLKTGGITGKLIFQSAKRGAGQVILLDPGNYNYDRNVGETERADLIEAVVRQTTGLQPVAQAQDNVSQTTWTCGAWTAGWQNGTARHVVVTKDYQLADSAPTQAVVTFPGKGHVYEMRSGKYYGYVPGVSADLVPTRGQVFTILPYRVKSLGLTAGKAARGQDLTLQVAFATEGKPGATDLSLLRVTVTDPAGREVSALRRAVEVRGGRGDFRLPLAYGDAPGVWTVSAHDTATGLKGKVSYRLP
jgi:hypothetical protein